MRGGDEGGWEGGRRVPSSSSTSFPSSHTRLAPFAYSPDPSGHSPPRRSFVLSRRLPVCPPPCSLILGDEDASAGADWPRQAGWIEVSRPGEDYTLPREDGFGLVGRGLSE